QSGSQRRETHDDQPADQGGPGAALEGGRPVPQTIQPVLEVRPEIDQRGDGGGGRQQRAAAKGRIDLVGDAEGVRPDQPSVPPPPARWRSCAPRPPPRRAPSDPGRSTRERAPPRRRTRRSVFRASRGPYRTRSSPAGTMRVARYWTRSAGS